MSDVATTHSPPRIPVWTFGDRLRKAREDAGIDQETMAAHFGVSSGTISNWERSGTIPRKLGHIGVAQKWEEVTGVPADWLLGVQMTAARLSSMPGQLRLELASSQHESTVKPSPVRSPPLLGIVRDLATLCDE